MDAHDHGTERWSAGHERVPDADGAGRQVVWLTGLPCSGKTTIARALRAADPARFVVLDGDELRMGPCADLGFTRADRIEQARRASQMAHERRASGRTVIVSTISPYVECREIARRTLSPGFLEVHVHASAATCAARDVKGQWRLAVRGELPHFTGVDDVYEPPRSPSLRLLTEEESVERSAARVLELLDAGAVLDA